MVQLALFKINVLFFSGIVCSAKGRGLRKTVVHVRVDGPLIVEVFDVGVELRQHEVGHLRI